MFVIAWIRSLFTRPARPAQHDTSLMRHLLRKNRNQSLRIKHLAKWRAADRQRIEQLLSEIHDLTARIGEMEADITAAYATAYHHLRANPNAQPIFTCDGFLHPHNPTWVRAIVRGDTAAADAAIRADTAAATTPEPSIDDPDTWTPAMLSEYNQATAEDTERQLRNQQRIIHSLAEHIRLISRTYHDHHADGETFENALTSALYDADQVDWEHADDYDGFPFPPSPDKTQHRPDPNTDTLRAIVQAIIETYDDDNLSGTELLDALSPEIGRARIALGMLDPDTPNPADLAPDVDFYDPVGDETTPGEAKPVRPPASDFNGLPPSMTPDPRVISGKPFWHTLPGALEAASQNDGANGTGEPDTARIETWDPSYPGQWRPLPTPAPRPYSPGGIL